MSFTALGDHLAIALPGGTALFTSRRGGVSEGPYASLNLGLWTDDARAPVRENRARVQNLTGGRLAQARQVHGTDIVEADPDTVAEADGQVTAEHGVAAMALVADCLPIALVAPEGVAMLHAAGVEDVHDCGLCTMHDAERFFSHRRERGVTGRQAGIAWRS